MGAREVSHIGTICPHGTGGLPPTSIAKVQRWARRYRDGSFSRLPGIIRIQVITGNAEERGSG